MSDVIEGLVRRRDNVADMFAVIEKTLLKIDIELYSDKKLSPLSQKLREVKKLVKSLEVDYIATAK